MRRFFCADESTYFTNVEFIDIYQKGKLLESIKTPQDYNRLKIREYLKAKHGKKMFVLHFKLIETGETQTMSLNCATRWQEKGNEARREQKTESPIINAGTQDNASVALLSLVETLQKQVLETQKQVIEMQAQNANIQKEMMRDQITDLKEIIKAKDNGGGGDNDLMTALLPLLMNKLGVTQ